MRSETQVFSLVNRQADLLHISMPAVIPEKPAPAIEDRVGLIAGVVIPLLDAGADDGSGTLQGLSRDAVTTYCAAGKDLPQEFSLA